jgi:hypothetical protein
VRGCPQRPNAAERQGHGGGVDRPRGRSGIPFACRLGNRLQSPWQNPVATCAQPPRSAVCTSSTMPRPLIRRPADQILIPRRDTMPYRGIQIPIYIIYIEGRARTGRRARRGISPIGIYPSCAAPCHVLEQRGAHDR